MNTSKATKAAAPAAPAAAESESRADRIARLKEENELMQLELENNLLRKRVDQARTKQL